MKKNIAFYTILLIVAACSSKKEGNMIVQGKIKGLKKGTLYLQKIQDSLLVSVDSVTLLGKDTFLLTDNIEDPIVYYLTFDGNTTDKRILFFGEKGTITINDRVERFGLNPKITGSKNQEILEKYYSIADQFRGKQLDLVKEDFEAKRDKDEKKLTEVINKSKKLIKRKYLFTVNFILKNANFEVAPYIALTELVNVNSKLLDTINSSLTNRIKSSNYGKRFQKFLKEVKENEKE